MTYALGLDIGTNSIGWSVIGFSAKGVADRIEDIGVRIFSDGRDPKSKTSLAVERRLKRAMRRSRDRYVRRRQALLGLLVEYGLMPLDKTERRQIEATAAPSDRPSIVPSQSEAWVQIEPQDRQGGSRSGQDFVCRFQAPRGDGGRQRPDRRRVLVPSFTEGAPASRPHARRRRPCKGEW
jgi:hypothetical protein